MTANSASNVASLYNSACCSSSLSLLALGIDSGSGVDNWSFPELISIQGTSGREPILSFLSFNFCHHPDWGNHFQNNSKVGVVKDGPAVHNTNTAFGDNNTAIESTSPWANNSVENNGAVCLDHTDAENKMTVSNKMSNYKLVSKPSKAKNKKRTLMTHSPQKYYY